MLQVLHFADLHLGTENYGRPDAHTGLHTRLLDFLRSFDELVDRALVEPVDLVVFAGDVYKSRRPNPTHQREFAARLHRLTSAGIPVVLVAGNHDLPATRGHANTLDIFATLNVPHVHIARKPGRYDIETRHGPVQVVAIPWMTCRSVVSEEELRGLQPATCNAVAVQRVSAMVAELVAGLNPHVPAILVAHAIVEGATYGSERSVLLGEEMALPLASLQNDTLDYVALGHVHRYQQLANQPPIVYSGSLDRIDFGEEEETKGFVLAQVERGRASVRFVPLGSARRFVTIDVQADGADPMAQIEQAVRSHDVAGAIVRMIIHTTAEKNASIDDNHIRHLLGDAFKVGAVVHDVRRPMRLRLGDQESIERLTTIEVLQRYFELCAVAPERVDQLLAGARQIMDPES